MNRRHAVLATPRGGALTLAACGQGPPGRPHRAPHRPQPLGHQHLPAQGSGDLEEAADLQDDPEAGIGWVKQQFPWEEIEQPRKGEFFDRKYNHSTWDKFDEIVKLAESAGCKLIARLDRPPAWARSDKNRPESPPERYEDFGDYVAPSPRATRGKVSHFQLWNEPNLGEEWTARPTRRSTCACSRSATSASRRPTRRRSCSPRRWPSTSSRARCTSTSSTSSTRCTPPAPSPTSTSSPPTPTAWTSPPPDPPNKNVLNFRRVELLRQVMEKNGDADKAVWFNEYAWNASAQGDAQGGAALAAGDGEAAGGLDGRGVQRARRDWPWAGVFCTWYFRQVGDIPPAGEYYFRLVDPDFTPRPVYTAVKQAATKK